MQKVVLAITGASGAIYAKIMLEKLRQMAGQVSEIGVVMSDSAKQVWEHELGNSNFQAFEEKTNDLFIRFYDKRDFNAPFASGSARFNTMIVVPCSMGTLGRIANGFSDDLVTRAADVILKERRKLILALRETPYNLAHIKNMELVTLAGGIVCPATPSFYSRPATVEDLASTVVDRLLDLAGFPVDTFRWGGSNEKPAD